MLVIPRSPYCSSEVEILLGALDGISTGITALDGGDDLAVFQGEGQGNSEVA